MFVCLSASEPSVAVPTLHAAGGTQARELRERAEAGLRKVQAKLNDAQHSVVKSGKAVAGATDDWVHTHPRSTIGAAGGIGFLIGLLIGRRESRQHI